MFKNRSYVEKHGKYLARKDRGWICHYCGCVIYREKAINENAHLYRKYKQGKIGVATVDHMEPLALGGEDTVRNMVLACEACNTEKGNRTYAEFTDKPKPTDFEYRGSRSQPKEQQDAGA